MLKGLLRAIVFVLTVVIVFLSISISGLAHSQNQFWNSLRKDPVPSLDGLQKPAHHSNKPTIAVLLGNEITEGLDFTIPYQIFSMTGAYNVYAVAEDTNVRSLSGGVDVIPHYSFKELDDLLGGHPELIVIPYMSMKDTQTFQPIRDWILKHKDTSILSICAGSDALASTGLLDGKTGATHWQTMSLLTRKYPQVNWVEDQRYVINDGGKMVSSAGISSGIDASLYVISQKLGEPTARKIADELKYPSYHFVQNPKVDPFKMDMKYTTYVLNNAFQWNEKKIGVYLYNGVEEMAIASVFDIYSDTGTTRAFAISQHKQPVISKNGLILLSRYSMENPPSVDKMIVPGKQAEALAAEDMRKWKENGGGAPVQFIHSGSMERFLFEIQLEDLAKEEDILTAKHAVKRLEFRAADFQLEGKPFPVETYVCLIITVAISLGTALLIDRRFMVRRKTTRTSG
ncbi:DJ-1/PfpI family protein [Paenibacillus chartarius]|uniref:DJ-1/PfpI family protein n=1 Tax=Paenibacillus chartarius TaxID=747481 RepID=A0ABV6DHZ2_9BACL